MNAANLRLGPANVYIYEKPRALLDTVIAGTHNDLRFVADKPGAGGNAITITYVVSANNTPLSVVVSGTAITVNVATNGGGAATSTAAQVRDAVNASPQARSLVYAVLSAGNDGTGVVAALAATNLAGGSDTGVAVDVGAMGEALKVTIGTTVKELTAEQTGDVVQDEVVTGGSVFFDVPFKEITFDNFARAIPNARVRQTTTAKCLDIVVRVGESRRQYAVKMELRPIVSGVETADPNEIIVIPAATAVAADIALAFNSKQQQEMPAKFRAWPDANGRWIYKGTDVL